MHNCFCQALNDREVADIIIKYEESNAGMQSKDISEAVKQNLSEGVSYAMCIN